MTVRRSERIQIHAIANIPHHFLEFSIHFPHDSGCVSKLFRSQEDQRDDEDKPLLPTLIFRTRIASLACVMSQILYHIPMKTLGQNLDGQGRPSLPTR